MVPDTPQLDQIRDIIAQSSVISVLEQKIAPLIDKKIEEECGLEQCGFRTNLSTHTQILRLINDIKSRKNKKKLQGLFVDMSSAYDLVKRKVLNEIEIFEDSKDKQI